MVTVCNIRYVHAKTTIKVCRPSVYGNPYTHLDYSGPGTVRVLSREEAVLNFAAYWYSDNQWRLRIRALNEIPENAQLGCVCHPLSCHADIIAGYLNWSRSNERRYEQAQYQEVLQNESMTPIEKFWRDRGVRPIPTTPCPEGEDGFSWSEFINDLGKQPHRWEPSIVLPDGKITGKTEPIR